MYLVVFKAALQALHKQLKDIKHSYGKKIKPVKLDL